ncbi:E3 ubiquitin-protein ligase TRIM39 isoform X2 [Labeo rohita]|uniref:E3 ubiquitin-protein ligase TRIM39 isoform X2 n=1 Tax=Labeo rohita TaxID=84645 RepID=UPI0021E281C8|nr:E3 ubiquitin-protein ligase TRIM39 isoform X2 [Labeo rohita]
MSKINSAGAVMRNLLYRLTDKPVLHTSLKHRTRKQESHVSSGKEKLKVCLSCCVFVSLYSCSKMAEARFSQDEFLCPVCLDLLKDPVAIHCGHSYCKSCITDCWDQEDQMRVYSCPQCRQTFSPRPALARNTILAEMVEKLKKTKLPADCYAAAGDVQCDVCTGRKYKAVKSCLVCLESYCQTHFERHEEFHSRKPHKVTDATGRLQEMICQKHEKILEVFCRTDQKCICVLCMDEHKNHDTVSAAAQRTEKQSFQSLSAPPESTDGNDDPFIFLFSFDGLRESVHQLRDKLEDFCKEELKKMSDRVTFTNIVPRTRNDFLRYSHQLTLDLNTVNKLLRLSENNRVITYTGTDQPYPDHPDRFDVYQVLCRESVCGRCYWELQWSGDLGVCISVSYKSISRKGQGKECLFGSNDQSWSLFCSPDRYLLIQNNIWTDLPVTSISSRIGVFVDHSAGTLSFYSVSDTMSLIHTVQTTFTQPLYPGFRVWCGSSVKLCW